MAEECVQPYVMAILPGSSEGKLWQDGSNDVPFVSGSGYSVGGGIKTLDDGRGIILPIEIAIESTVFGVRGGDAVGFTGIPYTDADREDNGRETALEYRGPQKRAIHL